MRNKQQHWKLLSMAAALGLAFALPVTAQDKSSGSTSQSASERSAASGASGQTAAGGQSSPGEGSSNRSSDEGRSNWGWLGLLGLLGLAGFRRRDNRHYDTTAPGRRT